MAGKESRSFVRVVLLEQDEGRHPREILHVDSEDVEEVERALAGRGLGAMGCDPEHSCYQLVRLQSLDALKRKYPKTGSRKRKTPKTKRRPTMGARKASRTAG